MGIRPFQDKAPALGERVYVDPASGRLWANNACSAEWFFLDTQTHH